MFFQHRDVTLYESLWSLVMFHHFAWNDLLEMIPWEFDAICSMTAGFIETQELRAQQRNNQMG